MSEKNRMRKYSKSPSGRSGDITDNLKERSQGITDNLKERSQDITDNLKERSREFSEKSREFTEKAAEGAGRTIARGIKKTRELSFYLVKFCIRLTIFLLVFTLYIMDRSRLIAFMEEPFFLHFSLFHVIWAIFMCLMISHLIPNNRLSMAWRKARGNVYRPVKNYDRLALLEQVQRMNIGAWKVLLVWLCFNAIFAALYLFGIIRAGDLLMLTVFFFLSDYICILFYCPFQSVLMHNKCCINCRIYDWGHFMMFTPMLFIKNFFSWSLFFMSCVVLIHWEIQYARHPERFWEGSNKTLQCATCKEKTCQIKRKLQHKL